ncbi:unnamed protein product [Moneuplotes crassus]|uniref:Uncharacterized protein n=1 Tax=Euplotes crassus TaxID=5936 RepID=A0AAD2D887_EUPCR|nr:unnamed protein product [Moneuplotes crassus]
MHPSSDSERSGDSPKQHNFKCKVRDNQEVGRWKKSEHEDFIRGLKMYGKDWKKIEALVKTRNGAQIRSHAQKWFSKVNKLKQTRTKQGDDIKDEELETMKILGERAKKRDTKYIFKEAEIEQPSGIDGQFISNPLENLSLHQNTDNSNQEKKYSDQDILLLIKFIVKEFAKVVQKWFYSQTTSLSGFNLPVQQANSNQMLLQLLMNKENTARPQENLHQGLQQQTNSKLLFDIMSQFNLNQSSSNPLSPVGLGTSVTRDAEPKENLDDIKTPEREDHEGKDDVKTVQSSEGRTDRKESISEENSRAKISLSEAYSILSRNGHLQSLFKNIPSFQ